MKRDHEIPNLFQRYVKLQRSGNGFIGRCPNHNDSNPSWSLFRDSDGTWLAKCHKCDDGAKNIFQFIQSEASCTFEQALEIVKEHVGYDDWETITTRKSNEKPEQKRPAYRYNRAATTARLGEAGVYLRDHGVSMDVARVAGVGVDDFPGVGRCVTFPYDGTNVKLRALYKKAFCHYQGTSTASLFYNFAVIDREKPSEIFIAESERDCLTLVSQGFPAISVSSATACLSRSNGGVFDDPTPSLKFSLDDLDKLRQVQHVYLALDQDAEGQKCAHALLRALPHAKILAWRYGGKGSDDPKDVGEIYLKDPAGFKDKIVQLCREAPAPVETCESEPGPATGDHPHLARFPLTVDATRETGDTGIGETESDDEAFDGEGRVFPFTDAGNGERLVARHGNNIRYVNDERGWRIWDGTRWNADRTSEIFRLALKTIRNILVEASKTKDSDHNQRDALAKWSLSCESRSRLENMVALAAKEKRVSTTCSAFDQSPWLFNCLNGTYDLETNTFRTARREDLLSKRSPVAFDPHATCPLFECFLTDILPPQGIRDFLQTSLGYTLSGHAWEKFVWFLIGEQGDNGKTTLIETIRYVCGEEDYAANMNFNSLLRREGHGPSGDIARLRGARFVSACESDQGQRLSPALLKRLSGGGDKITAAQKYKDEIEFVPTHKLWLATNYPPQLAAEDDALWRRIARVPFDVRIPVEKQDPRLQEKLKMEGAGILNWMIAGWKRYRAEGLKLPDEVREETNRYREASDVCKDFLNECVLQNGGDIGSTKLYQNFKDWFANTHNLRQQPMSQKMFSTRLSQLGYPIERRREGSVFRGIGQLIHDPDRDGNETLWRM